MPRTPDDSSGPLFDSPLYYEKGGLIRHDLIVLIDRRTTKSYGFTRYALTEMLSQMDRYAGAVAADWRPVSNLPAIPSVQSLQQYRFEDQPGRRWFVYSVTPTTVILMETTESSLRCMMPIAEFIETRIPVAIQP